MNKRGDEIVEAAIVLPIIILTILSLIMLIIYFYTCLNTQVSLHGELLRQANHSKAAIKTINKTKETSNAVGGVISLIMHKDITGRMYCIDETAMIRLGEMANEDN